MRVNKLVKILNWLPGLRVLTIICILCPFIRISKGWPRIERIDECGQILNTFLFFRSIFKNFSVVHDSFIFDTFKCDCI